MSFPERFKFALDRPMLRWVLAPCATRLAHRQGRGVNRIFCDDGVWIHQTTRGYFAYPHPFIRLDLHSLDAFSRSGLLPSLPSRCW